MFRSLRTAYIAILAVFSLVLVWSIYTVFVLGDASVYAENGPLENLQTALLVASGILFATRALRGAFPDRLLLWCCVWLCTSFVLREVDVERLDVPEIFKAVGSGVGRNTLLAASLLTIVAVALRNFRDYRLAALAFLKSRNGNLLMMTPALLLLGAVFEELDMLYHYTLYEESAELFAYCFVLAASLGEDV